MTGDVSDDLFFGGRLRLLQSKRGHRAGTDAALLVAAARSRMGQEAVVADMGAASGAVGLSLAHAGAASVALIEIDPSLAVLGAENIARNGLADHAVAYALDVDQAGRRGAPLAGSFDLVAANPPFDDVARFRAAPDKALAHGEPDGLMEIWAKAAARLLKPGGVFVLIHRPEALPRLFTALGPRFGDIRVRPVHPHSEARASRVLVSGVKGRRGALALLPAFVLHGADGAFTTEADAAQRGEASIAMD